MTRCWKAAHHAVRVPGGVFDGSCFHLIFPGDCLGRFTHCNFGAGEFVSSILLYTYSSRPISVEILSQLRTFNFGAAAAYCVMLLVLILAIVSVANRFAGQKSPARGW
jgi:iron(III) transport system permease protein